MSSTHHPYSGTRQLTRKVVCCTGPVQAGWCPPARAPRVPANAAASYRVRTDAGHDAAFDHWFDAFAQTHRFHIVSPERVIYNSRHTSDALIARIRRSGRIPDGFSFAQRRDPCLSLFRKFLSVFFPQRPPSGGGSKPGAANVGVTVFPDLPGLPTPPSGALLPSTAAAAAAAGDGSRPPRTLHALTDASVLQALDPRTLEPLGLARQTALHPDLRGQCSCAHAQTDPETGDVYNYNLELGPAPTYRVFCVSRATGATAVLATIRDAPAAYLHSFFLTPRYLVLCVFSAHFALGGLPLLYHRNVLDALDDVAADRPALWYVVDRRGGRGVLRHYSSAPFFAFHTVNAWEERGGIVAELPAFAGIDILNKFYMHNLLGRGAEAARWLQRGRPRFCRFWLAGVDRANTPGTAAAAPVGEAVKVWEAHEDVSFELPTVNPLYRTRPTRYSPILAHLAPGMVGWMSVARQRLTEWRINKI